MERKLIHSGSPGPGAQDLGPHSATTSLPLSDVRMSSMLRKGLPPPVQGTSASAQPFLPLSSATQC